MKKEGTTEDLRKFWNPPKFDKDADEESRWQSVADYGASTGLRLKDDVIQASALRSFLAGVDLVEGQNVVDFGCGVGRIARQLALMNLNVRTHDISAEIMEYAKDYCKDLDNIEFVLVDGHGCGDTPDGWAHLAVSAFVFQHMPSHAVITDCLTDIYRVLKRGGRAVIQNCTDGKDDGVDEVGLLGQRIYSADFVALANKIGFMVAKLDDPYGEESDEWYRVVLQK